MLIFEMGTFGFNILVHLFPKMDAESSSKINFP